MSVCPTGTEENHLQPLAEALRLIVDNEEFELPVLPEVAAQLLKLTNDVNCDPLEIVGLIRRDPSLTTHLLRIANSARYSTGITVSSIQQAVARLGLIRVREIVVLIACKCRIFDVSGFERDVRQSFRHSLAAAVFTQEIARAQRLNVEEAFLSGLLHDVGRPVLLQYLVDFRVENRLAFDDEDLKLAADEHRIPLGARLIHTWGLSPRVARTVLHQQSPAETIDGRRDAAALKLAVDVAERAMRTEELIKVADWDEQLVEMLSMDPETISHIITKRDEIMDWVDSTL